MTAPAPANPLTATALKAAVNILFAATPSFASCAEDGTPDFGPAPHIFIANHASHVDTLTLWASLPRPLRARTCPVAARDYWGSGALRRHIALRGLRAVLLDRSGTTPKDDVLRPAEEALAAGLSLILFPEGTRGASETAAPFKAGIYHLARHVPAASIVPVYLGNTRRSLPKGSLLPVPLICTAHFGTPLRLEDDESKDNFLARARAAVMELAPAPRPA